MGVFWDRLNFGSTAGLHCHTGKTKADIVKKSSVIATHLVDYDRLKMNTK